METYIVKDVKCVNEVVEIHMKTFTGFFLTFLGKGFLKQLYKGFVEHNKSGLIVSVENGKVLGFCAYSEDLSGFYKYLIKKRLLYFAWYAIGAFFRNPKVLFRLLRAFSYSSESKREEAYIELSSIGVLPEAKNKGVGSRLIQYLYDNCNKSSFSYIKLETDRDNNEGANCFYIKNGFVLDHSYETAEGRGMNEYRLYLGAKA